MLRAIVRDFIGATLILFGVTGVAFANDWQPSGICMLCYTTGGSCSGTVATCANGQTTCRYCNGGTSMHSKWCYWTGYSEDFCTPDPLAEVVDCGNWVDGGTCVGGVCTGGTVQNNHPCAIAECTY